MIKSKMITTFMIGTLCLSFAAFSQDLVQRDLLGKWGDYQTLTSMSGPWHTIVSSLEFTIESCDISSIKFNSGASKTDIERIKSLRFYKLIVSSLERGKLEPTVHYYAISNDPANFRECKLFVGTDMEKIKSNLRNAGFIGAGMIYLKNWNGAYIISEHIVALNKSSKKLEVQELGSYEKIN